jgi:hypothetical protein
LNQNQTRRNVLDGVFLAVVFALPGLTIQQVTAAVQGKLGFELIAPTIIAGMLLPLYVGSGRGAYMGSDVERVRGWIWFVVGNAIALALIIVDAPSTAWFSTDLGVFASGPTALVGVVLAILISRKMARTLGIDSSVKTRMSLISSFISAFLFPILCSVAVAVGLNVFNPSGNVAIATAFLFYSWLALAPLFLFVIVERTGEVIHSIPGDIQLHLPGGRQLDGSQVNSFFMILYLAGLLVLSVGLRPIVTMVGSVVLAIISGLVLFGWGVSAILMAISDVLAFLAMRIYLRYDRLDFITRLTTAAVR